MTLEQTKEFDRFFLHLFNQLLAKEEQLIQKKYMIDLTIRELHVIEAVEKLSKTAENTMNQIAKQLFITPGTLSISVNQLIQKKYLTKHSPANDRRISLIELTEEGQKFFQIHQAFHRDLCQFIDNNMDPPQQQLLLSVLEQTSLLLTKKIKEMGH